MNALYFTIGLILVLIVAYFLYTKAQQDKVVTNATVNAANAVQEQANRQASQQTTTTPVVYTIPTYYYRGWPSWGWRRPRVD